jgi:tetratricopeptide (TPR) repeat protein
MIPIFLILFLQVWLPDLPFLTVGKANSMKRQAQAEFENKNYVSAMVQYRYLRHTYKLTDEEIILNLAHCYFLLGDTTNARKQYSTLQQSDSPVIRTVALQQLGVLAWQLSRREQALALFKLSLLANPGNEDARYNFELLSLQQRSGIAGDSSAFSIPTGLLPPPPPDSAVQKPGEDFLEPDSGGGTDASSPPPAMEGGLNPERAEMLLKAIQSQENEYLRQRQDASSKRVQSNYKGSDW